MTKGIIVTQERKEYTAEQRLAVESLTKEWYWDPAIIAIVAGSGSGKAVEQQLTTLPDDEQMFMPELRQAKEVRDLVRRFPELWAIFIENLRVANREESRIRRGAYYHKELKKGRRTAPEAWRAANGLYVVGHQYLSSEFVITLDSQQFSFSTVFFRDAGAMVTELWMESTELSLSKVRFLNKKLKVGRHMFHGTSPDGVIRFALCIRWQIEDDMFCHRNFRVREAINAKQDYNQALVAREPFLNFLVGKFKSLGFKTSLTVEVHPPEPEESLMCFTRDLEL